MSEQGSIEAKYLTTRKSNKASIVAFSHPAVATNEKVTTLMKDGIDGKTEFGLEGFVWWDYLSGSLFLLSQE